MVKIGVMGTIGVGKSTFINALIKKLNELHVKTHLFLEPAMEDPDTHQILLNFYTNTKVWGFALEEAITKVHNRYYQEIDQMVARGEEGAVILDGPSNGDIFSRIFCKNGLISEEERDQILAMFIPFTLDIIIYLKESAPETIRRIKTRDRSMETSNLDYIYDHVRDYEIMVPVFLETRFPTAKVLLLENMPDVSTKAYDDFVNNLAHLLLLKDHAKAIDFSSLPLVEVLQ